MLSVKEHLFLSYDYFKSLYDSVVDNGASNVIANARSVINVVVCRPTESEVKRAIFGLKTAKSTGFIGLVSEFFLNSGV